MSYDPKPGTAAFRLLAALEALPHGEEVMSSRLAELAGVDPVCVVGSLTAARTAGAVFARKKGATERSPVFWSLVDHASAPAKPAPVLADASIPQAVRAELSKPAQAAIAAGATVEQAIAAPAARQRQEIAAQVRLQREAPAAPADPRSTCTTCTTCRSEPGLRIALWSDGTLQIQRAAGDVTLSRDETRQLVAYLDSIALDGVREVA